MFDIINFSNQLQNIIHENIMLKEENEQLKRENEDLNDFIYEHNKNTHENIRDIFSIAWRENVLKELKDIK